MDEVAVWVTRGNVGEVKIVLATIVAALALYQVALMTIATGNCVFPSCRLLLHRQPIVRSGIASSS